jgi:hypothetical protein
MRRLRAIAAIVALAVIWLGYSVARQIAAELGAKAPQQSATVPPAEGQTARYSSPVSSQGAAALGKLPGPTVGASIASADLPVEGAQASASEPVSTPTPFVNPLPGPSERESFQSASFNTSPGNGGSFRRRASGSGVSHAGGSGGGFGGGGGSTASAPEAGNGDAESGNGRPELLGRRLSSESSESGDDTGSTGKSGDNGLSGGGNGPNGNDGSDGNNGSDGNDGSNGSDGAGPGSDTSTGDEPGGGDTARTAGLSIEKSDEPLTVPEPGSMLMALGAAAVLARRRRR